MGDTKPKNTEMEKVEKMNEEEDSRSVRFRELRDDLFNEVAKLVSEDPSTRIAIFVNPPPFESDRSIHSFAHPSVETVVRPFLDNNCPVLPIPEDADNDADDGEEEEEEEEEDPSSKRSLKRFWWEDEKQYDSMNAEELEAYYDKLMRIRNHMLLQLEARQRAQSSGNQHKDDKDGSKP
ncbi:hypothetical protein AALP_AA3G135200 [Arabis alpina]|uniref:Uncharacterized protein n=1 Tax=Arabis alpina TaxID=50452 RepID=A0A087H902_ARAAL|nr:hypothetical protein AALP_AA3G135200 [Arabis alpina]